MKPYLYDTKLGISLTILNMGVDEDFLFSPYFN